ncbi:MAG: hypothetical protein CL878_13195 [Dehalococcoidia bacterium]|nr:hypothetical protein [Dehalococcoidia bacterium]
MSELLTAAPRRVRTRALAAALPQVPVAGQALPPVSLPRESEGAADRSPVLWTGVPRQGIEAARARAWQGLRSAQVRWAELLLRVAPHLTLLAIVLAAVWVGGIQRPVATLERAPSLTLEHPPISPRVPLFPDQSAVLPPSFLVRPVDPAPVARAQSQPSYELRTYVVQPGDTVWDIGERAGVGMWSVLWTNELEDDETLRPGQVLRIPPVPGTGRTVAAGDTLESIANRFKVDERTIVIANNLRPGVEPLVGAYLFVPGGRLPIPELIPGHATGRIGWPARGWISSYYSGWHPGIDVAASHGVPVYAADGGVVASTGWDRRGYGNRIVIDHRNGYVTTYSHLSRFLVGPGQLVQKGAVIGHNGSTGNSTGPHLHFEVLRNGYYVNPLQFLR